MPPSDLQRSCRHDKHWMLVQAKSRMADVETSASFASRKAKMSWISSEMMRGRVPGPFDNYGEMLYAEGLEAAAMRRSKVRGRAWWYGGCSLGARIGIVLLQASHPNRTGQSHHIDLAEASIRLCFPATYVHVTG